MARWRGRDDRGVAAVEFALILPVLLLLIMGIVDFGVRFQQSAMVNNAAMAAARDMSINHDKASTEAAAKAAVEAAVRPDSVIKVLPSVSLCPTGGAGNTTARITLTAKTLTGAFGPDFTTVGKAVAKCTT